MSDLVSINVMLKKDTSPGYEKGDQEVIIQVVMKNDKNEFSRMEQILKFEDDILSEQIASYVAMNLETLICDMSEDLA